MLMLDYHSVVFVFLRFKKVFIVLDSNFPFNSDLNQDIFDVHYFGRSGATTKTLLSSRHIQDCIQILKKSKEKKRSK